MSRILVVSPHPDDESFACGGTIRKHVLAGDCVSILFLTSGEQGGHGRPLEATLALREQEARAAAKILGAAETSFWRLPDGELAAGRELVERLAEAIGAWRADAVFTTHRDEMHADHRAASRAVVRAVRRLAAAGQAPRVWEGEVWTPLGRIDRVEDITEVMATKLEALRAHATQCAVLDFEESARGLNRYRGAMHSWPGGPYAEVFRRSA